MRKFLFTAIIGILSLSSFAQTKQLDADKVIVRQSLYLRDWYIDTVKRDTAFQGGTRSVPNSNAVYNFVTGRIAGAGYKTTGDSTAYTGFMTRWQRRVDSLFFKALIDAQGVLITANGTAINLRMLKSDSTATDGYASVFQRRRDSALLRGLISTNTSDIALRKLAGDSVTLSGFTSRWRAQALIDSLGANLKLPNVTANPTGVSGKIVLNTTTNEVNAYMNGVFEVLPTKNSLNSQFRTGKYVYVDTDNPFATDTRGTLSKYSLTQPFKTIQAAFNVMVTGDYLYVRTGTYNENVAINTTVNGSITSFTMFLDNCIINGGTGNAFNIANSRDLFIIMNGAKIMNTGSATDRHGTAAILTGSPRLHISGTGGTISSVEGDAYYSSSNAAQDFQNVTMTSTNGYCIYGSNLPTMINCSLTSSNNGALYSSSTFSASIIGSTIRAKLIAFDPANQVPAFTVQNSTLISDSSYAIGQAAQVLGGPASGAYTTIYNSTLKGYSGVLAYGLGNSGFDYGFRFENCKFIVGNSSATSAFNLPTVSASSTIVKATNTISNIALFSPTYRASAEGTKAIRESNTQTNDTTTFFQVKVGFGNATPTSEVDIQAATGYQQLRLRTSYTPTSSSDTNGAVGDWAWDDNYIYIRTSTGWKRLSASLSTF